MENQLENIAEPSIRPLTLAEHLDEFWKKVDWNRSNIDIAKELNCSTATVRIRRIISGHPKPLAYQTQPHSIPSVQRKITDQMIAEVDWESCTDKEISLRWCVSREYVRQIRSTHGKPACIYRGLRGPYKDAFKWFMEHRSEIENKHIHDITRMVPSNLPVFTLRYMLRRTGIPYQSNRLWKSGDLRGLPVNWELPNKWIALIWGWSDYVIGNHRCRYKIPPARWSGRGRYLKYLECPEFLMAIESEIFSAESNGLTPDRISIMSQIEKGKSAWKKQPKPNGPTPTLSPSPNP